MFDFKSVSADTLFEN